MVIEEYVKSIFNPKIDLTTYTVNYLYKKYCEKLYECKSDIKVSTYKYIIQLYLIDCYINTYIEICILKENIENN